jgi:hypothetical protein
MIDKKWKKGKEKKMRKKKWMANGWVTTAGGGEDIVPRPFFSIDVAIPAGSLPSIQKAIPK